ncbi:hypothetical protein CCR96_04075, partial [Halochromatium roseum]|nr:hypothetical protein [Halochromatium roseum]
MIAVMLSASLSIMPSTNHSTAADSGLDLLSQLYPPQTLLHVGIGHGAGPMHRWREWPEPEAVVLIDADAGRTQWAAPLVAERPHWHLLNDVVLDQADGSGQYYRASNPDEDGLLASSALTALWPNLRELDQCERPMQRLDGLLGELSLSSAQQAAHALWLLIDCLPAGRILRGAGDLLARTTVVWARVLLQPLVEDAEDALLSAIQAQLEPLHFRCVQITESHHPAVGYAVFVRDWSGQLRDEVRHLEAIEAQGRAAAVQQTAALNEQLEAAKAESAEQAKLAAEHGQQLQQATQAQQQAQAKVEELTKTLQQTTEARHQAEAKRDELAKAVEQGAQAKSQVEAKANDLVKALEAAKAESKQQAELAAQHKAEAEKQAQQVAQHKAEAEKQAKLAAERGQQLQQATQAQQQAQAKV